jgi:hypothetical protein
MLPALLLGAAGSARAQEQDNPRVIFEKHGLFGTWAEHCRRRASPSNIYYVYRPLDERRVQRDEMRDPTRGYAVGVVETATELGPHELEFTEVGRTEKNKELRTVRKLHLEGNRRRTMEMVTNGKKVIAEGRYLKAFGDGWGGRPVDWVYRCD